MKDHFIMAAALFALGCWLPAQAAARQPNLAKSGKIEWVARDLEKAAVQIAKDRSDFRKAWDLDHHTIQSQMDRKFLVDRMGMDRETIKTCKAEVQDDLSILRKHWEGLPPGLRSRVVRSEEKVE